MFEINQIYQRGDLQSKYGGQRRHGISTPVRSKVIFVFLSEQGKRYGYKERWENGILLCPGSGPKGDMEFKYGNKAIRDHQENGKDIHVFQIVESGNAQYIGQMVCIRIRHERAAGEDGVERDVILFELLPVETSEQVASKETLLNTFSHLHELSLSELRQKALNTTNKGATTSERKILYRQRSQAIKLYALERSGGICAGCDQPAPFKLLGGEPFLEVHHIDRLSDGGADDPKSVIAVCPNCHRRAHLSEDAESFNHRLRQAIEAQEKRL